MMQKLWLNGLFLTLFQIDWKDDLWLWIKTAVLSSLEAGLTYILVEQSRDQFSSCSKLALGNFHKYFGQMVFHLKDHESTKVTPD